jgi:Zn-dependent protease with chaperone function
VRVTRVWVVSWPCVNALALPWSRQLVYTSARSRRFDRDEIAAFTAHELGHLSEPASVKLVRSSGGFTLLPIGLTRPIIEHLGVVALLGVVAACYAVLFVVFAWRGAWSGAPTRSHTHTTPTRAYTRARWRRAIARTARPR